MLEKYDLERNNAKAEVWEYIEYNNYNLVEKYWKKLISDSKARFNKNKTDNKLYFINQLIYRMSHLKDDKQRKVFLITFFKSTYFNELNIESYQMKEYNFHQICYIFRFCPEIIIYSINKFKYFDFFKNDTFKKFLQVRYRESLMSSYNEEQLYYYYAIRISGFESLLKEVEDIVVESNNQILVSYYLKDIVFNALNIEKLKLNDGENYWFQNYHLILFSDLISTDRELSIRKYLMPQWIRNNPKNKDSIKKKQEIYIRFYKENLELNIPIIRNIDEVKQIIRNYIELKIEERIEVFGEENQ